MASLLRKLPSISEIVAQVSPASPGASHHDQSTAEIAAELRTSNPHGMIQVQLLSLDGVASPQPTPISCRVEVAGLVAESCFAVPHAEEDGDCSGMRWDWSQWLWFSVPRIMDPTMLPMRIKLLIQL